MFFDYKIGACSVNYDGDTLWCRCPSFTFVMEQAILVTQPLLTCSTVVSTSSIDTLNESRPYRTVTTVIQPHDTNVVIASNSGLAPDTVTVTSKQQKYWLESTRDHNNHWQHRLCDNYYSCHDIDKFQQLLSSTLSNKNN